MGITSQLVILPKIRRQIWNPTAILHLKRTLCSFPGFCIPLGLISSLFRLITITHNAVPSSSLYHQRMAPCQQTSKSSNRAQTKVYRLFGFYVFFFLSFMFTNSSLLFKNRKMMALSTAENRRRRQQELETHLVSRAALRKFFFRLFFLILLTL